MGLYIAKRIISLHYSGDITLSNKQDEAYDKNDTSELKAQLKPQSQLATGCIAQAIFK